MFLDPFRRRRFRLEIRVGIHCADRESRLASCDRVLVSPKGITVGNLDSQAFCQAMAGLGFQVVAGHSIKPFPVRGVKRPESYKVYKTEIKLKHAWRVSKDI